MMQGLVILIWGALIGQIFTDWLRAKLDRERDELAALQSQAVLHLVALHDDLVAAARECSTLQKCSGDGVSIIIHKRLKVGDQVFALSIEQSQKVSS
jgi:hypothetical protein